MKNIDFKFRKIIIILFILTFSVINTQKINAQTVTQDIANLGINLSEKTRKTIDDVQKYIVATKNLYSTYQAGNALVQQIKNFNLSEFAKNNSADQILSYGQLVLKTAAGNNGIGINVNTNGEQIITNLGNYIDKIGANEIRKAVEDTKEVTNQTPFRDEILKSITTFSKGLKDSANGKIVTFTLPYIARNEICNDPKLKDVIKNGEPADFTKPKPAVGNVDIDKLCNSSAVSNMSAEDQATFTGLAKAGYGGEKTNAALRDPANTTSGVISTTLSRVLSKKNSAEETASKQVEATNLNTGQQFCFDKDGKKVEFDMTSSDDKKRLCYSQNSTVDQSGSVSKDRIATALMAPYTAMMARATAISNKTKECKAPITSGANDTYVGVGGGTEVNTTAISNKLNSCLSAASMIMTNVTDVLNIGGSNVAAALTGEDNPYSRLANDLQGIIDSQNNVAGLYADANQSQKDYALGDGGYTIDDLKNRITLYKNLREFNVTRLNNEVLTYAFLQLAIEGADSSIGVTKAWANAYKSDSVILSIFNPIGNLFGGGSKKKSSQTVSINTKNAVAGFYEAIISISKDIRELIKQMSRNNYTEQQMNKLMEEFKNTESRAEDNQESLKSLLDEAITEEDFANMQLDWNYTPRYIDVMNDPTAPSTDTSGMKEKQRLKEEAKQSVLLVPPKEEREGPYTDQNIFYLRARAWKTYKLGASANSSVPDLLKRYGMSKMSDIDVNLPRVGTKGALNVLTANQIATWSDLSFCNNLELTNTSVCDDNIINNLLSQYTGILNFSLPTEEELNNYCSNIEASVEKDCQSTKDPSLITQCQDTTQKQSLIEAGRLFCSDGPDE